MKQSQWKAPNQAGRNITPTMQIFTGRCLLSTTPPVVGKVVFPNESQGFSGACLPVLDNPSALAQLEDPRTVGVIWIGDGAPSPEVLARSACPILSLPRLPQSCRGRIALLDPSCATLFVSPDLKTVNRYTSRLAIPPITGKEEALHLPNGKRIRLGILLSPPLSPEEREADGFLIDPDAFPFPCRESEEGYYELLCDIAERTTGLPLTAICDIHRGTVSREHFHAQIRGLFRGAVYGNFSLLLRGILTEEELRQSLCEIHRVFCELESEGREFNGYIPKGILIRSPLLVSETMSLDGIDFLCFDLERLFALMSDNAPADPELQCRIGERIALLCERHPGISKAVALGSLPICPELCRILLRCGITEWYLPASRWDSVRETLRQTLRAYGDFL